MGKETGLIRNNKEIFLNPEKFSNIPLRGTNYDQYFMGCDPATGESQLYLQNHLNQGAMPIPRHLWEKKKPEKPMLIIEPPTQEQLEADFKLRMLEYKLSQAEKRLRVWPWLLAAFIVWAIVFILKTIL